MVIQTHWISKHTSTNKQHKESELFRRVLLLIVPWNLIRTTHISKDLKAGSKASGIIGAVGGRFWDCFSWSRRDFPMYLPTYLWGARPWHPRGWRAVVTAGLQEKRSSRNGDLSLYLSLTKFLAFHGVSWWGQSMTVGHSATRNLVAQQVKCHQLLTSLNTNNMVELKMQCSFLQLSTDHIKHKSSWKLEE